MMLMIGLELIGLKAQPKALQTNHAGRELSKGNCIIMFPTNGVGFGHFTRLLAIGKRMKKQDPSLEIIFFTTMVFQHIIFQVRNISRVLIQMNGMHFSRKNLHYVLRHIILQCLFSMEHSLIEECLEQFTAV
jgi:predicted glycosyltransferase